LRGLAVAARERLAILPEIPTMAEAGFPGVEASGWNGIFVPVGTPGAIIHRLQEEIAKVLRYKDVEEDAARLGTQGGGERPEEFAAYVRAEIEKWGRVVKDAGIKPQ
jgi:tripartite-type tricarboxylate transporter receptor subunit TctC